MQEELRVLRLHPKAASGRLTSRQLGAYFFRMPAYMKEDHSHLEQPCGLNNYYWIHFIHSKPCWIDGLQPVSHSNSMCVRERGGGEGSFCKFCYSRGP
ncbi:mCG1035222 [Mus musculus]|nr:mCG1035222 [Mus musculus]